MKQSRRRARPLAICFLLALNCCGVTQGTVVERPRPPAALLRPCLPPPLSPDLASPDMQRWSVAAGLALIAYDDALADCDDRMARLRALYPDE